MTDAFKALCVAVAIAALVPPSARASEFGQSDKLYIEGAVSFSVSFTRESGESTPVFDQPDRMNVVLAGTLGIFVVDGLFLGGTAQVDHHSVATDPDNDEVSETSCSIGVAARYYLAVDATRTTFFKLGGFLGYASQSDVFKHQEQFDFDGYKLGATIGLAFPFGDEHGGLVDIGLGYEMTRLWPTFGVRLGGMETRPTALMFFVGLGAFL